MRRLTITLCLTLLPSVLSAQSMFLLPGEGGLETTPAIHVSPTGKDSNSCGASGDPCATIAQALVYARGDGTLVLAAGRYTEHNLQIKGRISLIGAGRDKTVIDAGQKGRILSVNRDSAVRLVSLTTTGGRVQITRGDDPEDPPSGVGGGISNRGDLTLLDVAVLSNEIIGAPGHDGAKGADGGPKPKKAASGRKVDCGTKRGNCADPIFGTRGTQGGSGKNGTRGLRGGSVWGGGIYSTGRLTVINSLFAGNRAVGGKGGKGGDGGNGGPGGDGGNSAYVVIFTPHPKLLVPANYCVARPGARGGDGGWFAHGNHGGRGGSAFGGAIYAKSQGKNTVTIVNSEFLHNAALPGAGGDPGKGGKGGAPGSGGSGGNVPKHCVKMPDSDSSRGGGGTDRRKTSGETGNPGNPGSSEGGGFYSFNAGATVETANVVVAGNQARLGGGLSIRGPAALRHATIVGNFASENGGAITLDNDVKDGFRILNSIVWANTIGGQSDPANNGLGDTTQVFRETHRDGTFDPVILGSCFEGLSGPAATNGGNLDNCKDPGLARPDWRTARFDPGDRKLAPGLGSSLIDAGAPAHLGLDLVDLDGDGDRAETLPNDISGAKRLFNYPFRVTGMMPRTAKARPDIGAFEATVDIMPWEIGKPITPPSAALKGGRPIGQPEIQPIPARNRFYWDPVEARLTPVAEYQTGPVTISWPTGNADRPAFQLGRPDWPDDAKIVIAHAPINLTPAAGQPLKFYAQGNPLAESADYEPALSGLAEGEARLLTFLPVEARNLNEAAPRFLVLRGAPASDLATTSAACIVGQPITHPEHSDPAKLNGFVADPAAPVDMGYAGAPYARDTRSGPIIPVNASTEPRVRPLIVGWYRPGLLGITWPEFAVRHDCTWPKDATPFAPGDREGLPLAGLSSARIWNQPDTAAPGFKPNRVHATIAPGPDGQVLHVLRNVQGAHVLVRYAAADGGPGYRIYSVAPPAPTGEPVDHVIGRTLKFPAAIAHLGPQSCEQSAASGPAHRDHTGAFWATSPDAPVTLRWYYRIEPTMARDLDIDGTADLEPGACHPWLGDDRNQPRPNSYKPRWPEDIKVLRVGESFDLDGAPAVRLVHGTDISARLQPIGRVIAAPLEDVPAAAKRDRLGRLTGLPGTLSVRLFHDKGQLQLRGGRGADGQILVNRLSRFELERAKSIAPGETAWSKALDALNETSNTPENTGARLLQGESPIVSTGAITGTGEIVLILNDLKAAGTPVEQKVLRVSCPVVTAPLRLHRRSNLFDPAVSFSYGADFGGETDRISFEWRRRALADPAEAAKPADPGNGWNAFPGSANLDGPAGEGGRGMTIAEFAAGDPALLENTAIVARLRGFEEICGQTATPWSGTEAGTADRAPLPSISKSWTSLVAERVNPFDARRTDLAEGGEATTTSLLALAGSRYEGDIQLSSEGALNAGLIEIYETLLNRARRLAFGDGGRTSPGVNADIAQVAGRLGELYRALGDEAVADALDPSIVTTSEIGEDRARASSIFAFAAYLPSRLEEELALLRGRTGTTGTVRGAPWYNRLRWSTDTGEKTDAVYVSTYGIERVTSSTGDTPESALDYARALYPQGHGDAWGHYLTGLKYFYGLFRQPDFAWTATVNLAEGTDGAVSLTASSEEEVFAALALEKADTGARIANLQFRKGFRESQIDRLLGYPGGQEDRANAWGLGDWARRAGQGAYLDWTALNAALPAPDCAPCPESAETILRIDRSTVPNLPQIPLAFERIQLTLERASAGLTPLGLPHNIVPFGLDLDRRVFGKEGQFRQVFETALDEVQKARAGLHRVELALRDLRRTRTDEAERVRTVAEREAEAKKALVELFGAPYVEDMVGANALYPPDYDGPDIHNYDIVDFDTGEFFGQDFQIGALVGLEVPRVDGLTEIFSDPTATIRAEPFGDPDIRDLMEDSQAFVIDQVKLDAFEAAAKERDAGTAPTLRYVFAPELGTVLKPRRHSKRSKYGELQFARLAFLREFGQLRQQIREYDDLSLTLREQLERLKARVRGQEGELNTQKETLEKIEGLQESMITAEIVQAEAEYAAQTTSEIAQIISSSNPVTAWAVGMTGASIISRQVATVAQIERSRFQNRREITEMTGQLRLIAGESREYELLIENTGLFETAQRQRILREGLAQQELTVREAEMRYLSLLADAEREIAALVRFRQETASDTRSARYADSVNRLLRDEALAAYEAQLDQAARHVYLAAKAYQYETGAYGFGDGFRTLLGDILRKRSLGQLSPTGEPMAGSDNGLIGILGRLRDNFVSFEYNSDFRNAEKTQLHLSLRNGLLRDSKLELSDNDRALLAEMLQGKTDPTEIADTRAAFMEVMAEDRGTQTWGKALTSRYVADLRALAEFRRCCLSARDMNRGPLPGLAITFETRDRPRRNLFGLPRQGSDPILPLNASAHRIAGATIVLEGFPKAKLGPNPQVFLVPVGADITRPAGDPAAEKLWQVFDAKLPPVRAGVRVAHGLDVVRAPQRAITSMRAHPEVPEHLTPSDMNTRLLGRSLENTRWLLVIPGEGMPLNGDPQAGIDLLLGDDTPALDDIEIWFDVYSFSDGG